MIFEPCTQAIRCYTPSSKPVKKQNPEQTTDKTKKPFSYNKHVPDMDDVMVWDTETTTDEYQNMLFGCAKRYSNGRVLYECLFYNDEVIKDKQFTILQEYASTHNINLLTKEQFINDIFYKMVYRGKIPCIGFNLPFDLSRLAYQWDAGKRKHKDAFEFTYSHDETLPNIRIKHNNSKSAFIEFKPQQYYELPKHLRGFKGHFLDLRTLAFALTNSSHTLASAGDKFNCDVKKTVSDEHGNITPEYIGYCINDVDATYSLFQKIIETFNTYNLPKLSPTKAYSPASIGKAYLDAMGINSFEKQNPDFPQTLIGNIMACYYGGRSEVKIRKDPVKVAYIDFLSMYPSVCTLQELWKFVIADKITYVEDTANVINFVEKITLDKLREQDIWKQLHAIVQIIPDDDILPVRAKYGSKDTFNIGLNHLTRESPIWYPLADVISSKILTGKTPKIIKAVRFNPEGVQPQINAVELIGDKQFNPVTEDLFKTLIEYRNEIKVERKNASGKNKDWLDNKQNIVKIISNATSYGIYAEINTDLNKQTAVKVYSNDDVFNSTPVNTEKTGKAFNPLISVLITSAARLVLAITEAILQKYNVVHAFADTDGIAVPQEHVEEIQGYFQSLNPYAFDTPVFKLEDENFNEDTKKLEDLYFYGISAKRYVLYNIRDGKPHIRKHSSHGLGHLMTPYGKGNEWEKDLWEDILNDVYKFKPYMAWDEHYKLTQFTLSTPLMMNRVKALNQKNEYRKQIKPFNFVTVGYSSQKDPGTGIRIQPIAAYQKDPKCVVYNEFIDKNTGKVYGGTEYWNNLFNLLFAYKNHPESKFNGDVGVLERKHLRVVNDVHIGKETNNLEEMRVFGVDKNDTTIYTPDEIESKAIMDKEFMGLILHLNVKDCRTAGIPSRTLELWKQTISSFKPLIISRKNLAKLMPLIPDMPG